MLPAASRLRQRRDFTETVARGARAGRPTLVVHLDTSCPVTAGPRAGFVVSKAVGGSVVRHRVVRRLRGLVAASLPGLPPGARLVVRALPPAATASSADLGHDLDEALRRAATRGRSRPAGLAAGSGVVAGRR